MSELGNVIFLVLFSIFSLAAAVQLFYYFFFYLPVHKYKTKPEIKPGKPVSVIICARNEAENLEKFLPSILEQDYPDYEVIVVNDCSEDNSYNILGKFLEKYPHLKVSNINKDPKFTHNKKFAQFIGIKAAKNELLLFTDADCKPVSNKWIEGMTVHFDERTNYVLGYGGYLKKSGWLNAYIRYDAVTIAMQYFGMAIRGIPYMGVGRNLAYRRSVFFRNKGFGSHNHLASGDDDLFINDNAHSSDTRIEFDPEYHTVSLPMESFSNWYTQKRRHLTTAPYYKMRDKMLLATEPLSRMIFYITAAVLLAFTYMWIEVLAIFGVRLITQVTVLNMVQKRLKEKGLVTFSLIFDIISPVINGIVYLGSNRRKPGKNEWR
jgi:cellulose synthase/poly-beta-1,6-N-acetylglucosamine synthase-like glycosyltransferase